MTDVNVAVYLPCNMTTQISKFEMIAMNDNSDDPGMGHRGVNAGRMKTNHERDSASHVIRE